MPDGVRTFAIYDHPEDHPDKFVVREWVVIDGAIQPGDARLADTLEAARRALPEGAIQAPITDPDPTILESWIAPGNSKG